MLLFLILRFEKSSRRSYDYLLINLMLADLFMVVPNFPLAGYNSWHGHWMSNSFGKLSVTFNEKALFLFFRLQFSSVLWLDFRICQYCLINFNKHRQIFGYTQTIECFEIS